MNQEKIGKYIRKIRKDNNLSQEKFAEKLGVTFQAVSKWERGINLPDMAILKAISDEFNIPIDDIINGEESSSCKKSCSCTTNSKNSNNKYILVIVVLFLILIICIIFLFFNRTSNSNYQINDVETTNNKFKVSGTVIKGEKGKYRLGDSVTQIGELKTLSETERNAYLENHKELNTTVQSLIEKGHAEGVNIERNFFYDTKGNQLFINQNGEIIGVKLKEAMKDSAGNDVKVLKDGKDRTLLDSWLYNNAEAKEFAKKEFDSGLARDGSRFIAA